MDEHITRLNESAKGMFAELLGIRFIEASPDGIVAEIDVEDRHCTLPGIMHGGAVMGLADALGGMATALNLKPDYGTTTIESKTNFLAAGRAGTTVTAECRPLHRGGRTMVWQTTVRGADGKTVAVVTQTQLVIEPRRSPQQQLSALFEGKPAAEQKALLAQLERGGAAVYRHLAEGEADAATREALLQAARKEEENAETLEGQA